MPKLSERSRKSLMTSKKPLKLDLNYLKREREENKLK